jgi:flagellin
MRIHTNVSALRANRELQNHTKEIDDASLKIATGERVRSASDDAASLSIGLKQKAKIRSQGAALRNANDAVSSFQVAEGSMSVMSGMLTRLRELSIQSASDTVDQKERSMLDLEYMSLRREIQRISKTSEFNGLKLLDGSNSSNRDFQVDTNHNAESRLSIKADAFTLNEFNMGLVDSNLQSKEDAKLNLEQIDGAINVLAGKRALVGAYQNRMEHAIENLQISKENESHSKSVRLEADVAEESAKRLVAQNKLNISTGVLAQTQQISAKALKLLE